MKIENCCSLCLSEDCQNGDNLIWRDGMQLCKNCYEEYSRYEYKQQGMLVNAIKLYRRQLACKLDNIQELEYRLKQKICIEAHEQVKQLYISKEKVKNKIEELEKLDFGTDLVSQFTANLTTITILQSLLEEE